MLDPSLSFPLRTEGDNIRNTFEAGYAQDLTGNFGAEIGYSNSLFDYDEDYHSALLNRQYNSVDLAGTYNLDRLTKLRLGYKFASTDFDGLRSAGARRIFWLTHATVTPTLPTLV